jgi:hypothetical protein
LPDLQSDAILRVIDANCNRLREALRVIEEYVRFVELDERHCVTLKELRHSLIAIESAFGRGALVRSRDTASDPFANTNRPEELRRSNVDDILIAGFKRAQEASRALEEYCKVTRKPELSERAKTIRFTLYAAEKSILEGLGND